MYYGNIKKCDIANGPGIRVSLFVSGCRNRCKGCFQPETWSFSFGSEFTSETEKLLLDELSKGYVNGLTLLGGDPFEQENQKVLLPFLKKVKAFFPQKSIWAYTGYIFEDLESGKSSVSCEHTKDMISLIDVMVDGPFVEELKDISLVFRGSSNQRIIDVQQSLAKGETICWEVY